MTDSPISFPGLFGDWQFTASSVALHIGSRSIYWYGILITLGLVLALALCMRQKEKYGISEDNLLDGVLWGIPCGILGARIYYVLFYLDNFKNSDGSFSWSKAIAIWDGGLAIYGTVITVVIIALCLSRRKGEKGFKFFAMTDLVVIGLFVGQFVGRWGNFMNREAHGAVTDAFLKMGLQDVSGVVTYYHPTFLYESVWNLVGFIGLHFFSKKRKFDGEVFLAYVAWYGLGRVWIEGLRTDSLYLFSTGIRVSQLVAAVSFLAAGGVLAWVLIKKKPTPDTLYVNRRRNESQEGEKQAD